MKAKKKTDFEGGNPEAKVKSLEKALTVLECFDSASPELGIAQIAEKLNLNKSNVHNIVSTFEKKGYLEQDKESKRYRLGFKLLEYTYVINKTLTYQKAVYDIISYVSRELSFITYFAIPQKERIFYLNSAYPPGKTDPVPYRIIIGETAPYYCTSLGKAMLAFMPENDVQRILKLPRPRFTEYTITDKESLQTELERIRKNGYALDNEEHEIGITCMGIPIFAKNGSIVGGISISGPVFNFDKRKIRRYLGILTNATRELKSLF
ncbi:IclR family transcriptional regulator [Treponema sp. HNW]|uniref:IclR family transcriptional regulator n=1 Tax=Treponema sp. HNW TaxID=3116654 RepID=UPI003D0D86E3